MKVQHSRCVGYSMMASMVVVLLSGDLVAGRSGAGCNEIWLADGWCDDINNKWVCGYDDGDCCEESCVDTDIVVCGVQAPYDCIDPDYANPVVSYSFSFEEYIPVGDGNCDSDFNFEEYGYDAGDCCPCTCISTDENTCGAGSGYACVDPNAPCFNEYVEAGTVTTVTVTANSYDVKISEEFGCMDKGCLPSLTRDGNTTDAESRWSCRQSDVPDEELCAITFSFEETLDVRCVQVAYWKADERSRTLELTSDGEHLGDIVSTPSEDTFTRFGLHENEVETLTLTTSGLGAFQWISVLEVRILVEVEGYP